MSQTGVITVMMANSVVQWPADLLSIGLSNVTDSRLNFGVFAAASAAVSPAPVSPAWVSPAAGEGITSQR